MIYGSGGCTNNKPVICIQSSSIRPRSDGAKLGVYNSLRPVKHFIFGEAPSFLLIWFFPASSKHFPPLTPIINSAQPVSVVETEGQRPGIIPKCRDNEEKSRYKKRGQLPDTNQKSLASLGMVRSHLVASRKVPLHGPGPAQGLLLLQGIVFFFATVSHSGVRTRVSVNLDCNRLHLI